MNEINYIDSKQRLMIEYLISSPVIYRLCMPIIKKDYFSPEFRNTIHFLEHYFNQYNSLPTQEQIFAETQMSYSKPSLTQDTVLYCCEEIERFCRHKAVEQAILSSPPLIKRGEYKAVEKQLKEAIRVSIKTTVPRKVKSNDKQDLNEIIKSRFVKDNNNNG